MSLNELTDVRNLLVNAQSRLSCLENHKPDRNGQGAQRLDNAALTDVRRVQDVLSSTLETIVRMIDKARGEEEFKSAPVEAQSTGKYPYDPELPFVVVGKISGKLYARFCDEIEAREYDRATTRKLDIVDTTPKPKPKIPLDALVISWIGSDKDLRVAQRNRDLWRVNGVNVSEKYLLEAIGDAEIEVLGVRQL